MMGSMGYGTGLWVELAKSAENLEEAPFPDFNAVRIFAKLSNEDCAKPSSKDNQ